MSKEWCVFALCYSFDGVKLIIYFIVSAQYCGILNMQLSFIVKKTFNSFEHIPFTVYIYIYIYIYTHTLFL